VSSKTKTFVDIKIQIAYAFDETAVVFWKMKPLKYQEMTVRQWMRMAMAYPYDLRNERATMELVKHVKLFHGYGRPHALATQTMPKMIFFVPSGQRARPELHAHGRKYSVSKKR